MILLDRDGVLNVDRASSVRSVADLEVEVGAVDGCARLRAAGHRLVVITNQSAVGRGLMSRAELDAVHSELDHRLGGVIDAWYVCPHGPDERCRCRKPDTLLLEQAQGDFGFDPASTWFVVDAVRDVEASLRFGCRPAIVRTGKGATAIATYPDVPAFADLAGFADFAAAGP
jgi:D-glycero-D-manno-heptose 1,7-bisphosphate phosphatase